MALPKWTDERTDALTNFVGVLSRLYLKLLLQKQQTSLKLLLVLSLANCERWATK